MQKNYSSSTFLNQVLGHPVNVYYIAQRLEYQHIYIYSAITKQKKHEIMISSAIAVV